MITLSLAEAMSSYRAKSEGVKIVVKRLEEPGFPARMVGKHQVVAPGDCLLYFYTTLIVYRVVRSTTGSLCSKPRPGICYRDGYSVSQALEVSFKALYRII